MLSMLELMATGTRTHADSSARVSGLTVARSLRESTLSWSYSALLAKSGQSFTPPIDAAGAPMTVFSDWQQTLQVQAVDPDNLSRNVSAVSPVAVRVTAHAVRAGKKITALT